MKVAVSIPDPIFAEAEKLAKRWNTSRSKIYARALDQFVANHNDEELTQLANAYADEVTEVTCEEQKILLRAGARTALKNTEW